MVRVDGRKLEWHEGMTVGDLLRELADPYPYAVVRIDGRVVTAPEFEKAPVPDNAQVSLLHLIAGG
jgi:thiamine biosynthesis protein ThiS